MHFSSGDLFPPEMILKYKFHTQFLWSWLTCLGWEVPQPSKCLLRLPVVIRWLQMLRSMLTQSSVFSFIFCLSIPPSSWPPSHCTSCKFGLYFAYIILSNPFPSPFARGFHPLNYSHTTETIIEQLWEPRGQKPPGRGRNDQLGLGSSWGRFGLTIQFGGFCNIRCLHGISLPKGTSSRLNSLCALPYLAFIPKPIAICTSSRTVKFVPEAQLPCLISYHPPGQKLLVFPKACQYASHTTFPILSTKL